jgi:AcrR family transcriptional regulator
MPRRYDLGKRLQQKDDTRRRIVAAAAELYREQGVSQTSMAQVARRADVAPGTFRNHFATTDALAQAVADHVLDALRMPQPAVLDGLATVGERLRVLAHEMGSFYERSQPWYRIQQLETSPVRAWEEAEAGYYAAFDRLIHEALAPMGPNDGATAVVAAMLQPAVFATLRSRGSTAAGAADLIADVLGVWLATPLAAPEERALRR